VAARRLGLPRVLVTAAELAQEQRECECERERQEAEAKPGEPRWMQMLDTALGVKR
jgi:hypothetical protein